MPENPVGGEAAPYRPGGVGDSSSDPTGKQSKAPEKDTIWYKLENARAGYAKTVTMSQEAAAKNFADSLDAKEAGNFGLSAKFKIRGEEAMKLAEKAAKQEKLFKELRETREMTKKIGDAGIMLYRFLEGDLNSSVSMLVDGLIDAVPDLSKALAKKVKNLFESQMKASEEGRIAGGTKQHEKDQTDIHLAKTFQREFVMNATPEEKVIWGKRIQEAGDDTKAIVGVMKQFLDERPKLSLEEQFEHRILRPLPQDKRDQMVYQLGRLSPQEQKIHMQDAIHKANRHFDQRIAEVKKSGLSDKGEAEALGAKKDFRSEENRRRENPSHDGQHHH